MARPLRPLVPGGVYHVMGRGNGKAEIYLDDEDCAAFLAIFARTLSRFGWRCFSYCLMGNHFHVLVQTPEPNLSRGVQYLKSSYAQWFNTRHDHWGHVFGGRYKSPLIQQDAHLLRVFKYIALNPVRAGLCESPGEWWWSAHAALVGTVQAPKFLDVEGAHAWFGDSRDRRNYAEFVAAAAPVEYEPSCAVYGDEEFRREVLPPRRPNAELPERDWGAGRPPVAEILRRTPGPEGIGIAYRSYGYALAPIAAELGCHVSTVSRRLARYEREVLESKI